MARGIYAGQSHFSGNQESDGTEINGVQGSLEIAVAEVCAATVPAHGHEAGLSGHRASRTSNVYTEDVIGQARNMEPEARAKFLRDAVNKLEDPRDQLQAWRQFKYRKVL